MQESLKEIVALEARIEDGKPLSIKTLREGMQIQRELDRLGWPWAIKQLTLPTKDESGVYSVSTLAYGEIKGKPEQLCAVLALVPATPATLTETPGESWPNGVN